MRLLLIVSPKEHMMRNFILGALLVALIAFAGFYFYKQDHVTIEKPTLPKVETH
ncbi:MAG TPA: hypothetical protein VEK14_09300 [Rhodomicrobium sp.]|nr:hypothetical protein [Rhodomicrobium sp.]